MSNYANVENARTLNEIGAAKNLWQQPQAGMSAGNRNNNVDKAQENINRIKDFVDLSGISDDDSEEEDGVEEITAYTPNSAAILQEPPSQNEVAPPWEEIHQVKYNNFELRAGKSVELMGDEHFDPKSSFLTIKRIVQNVDTEEVELCGTITHRSSKLGFFNANKHDGLLNEVYIDAQVDISDPKSLYEQSLTRVPLSSAKKLRRIIFTHRSQEDEPGYRKNVELGTSSKAKYKAIKSDIKHNEVLVCRHIVIRRYTSPMNRKKNKITETELRQLFEGEHPLQPKSEWKLKPRRRPSRYRRARCSYATGFGGAGGDATGAFLANVDVKYMFDNDKKACITFELNHPDAIAFYREAFDMIHADVDAIPQVVILHLSTVCKFFSAAHTRPGKNDGENIATLYSTGPLLEKLQPLFHTQEQTSGLISHHPLFFASLIREIVKAGYNLRWGIHQFADYGLASRRNRLVIFAAKVGSPLPRFPVKTHGPEALLPWVSIHDAISNIADDADWHLDTVTPFATPRLPYDGRTKWANCITCSSDSKTLYHPSGERGFTIREIAALMGFPAGYIFAGKEDVCKTEVRKQLGNAVPPIVWQKFVAMIKQTKDDWENGKINEAGDSIAQSINSSSSESRITDSGNEKSDAAPEKRKKNAQREYQLDVDGIELTRKKVKTIDLTKE